MKIIIIQYVRGEFPKAEARFKGGISRGRSPQYIWRRQPWRAGQSSRMQAKDNFKRKKEEAIERSESGQGPIQVYFDGTPG